MPPLRSAEEIQAQLERLREERRQRERDRFKAGTRIWILDAPTGVPQSGSTLVEDLTEYGVNMDEIIQQYKDMGWSITQIDIAGSEVLQHGR